MHISHDQVDTISPQKSIINKLSVWYHFLP